MSKQMPLQIQTHTTTNANKCKQMQQQMQQQMQTNATTHANTCHNKCKHMQSFASENGSNICKNKCCNMCISYFEGPGPSRAALLDKAKQQGIKSPTLVKVLH
jgi:phosphopantothenoylcysteine synthetase/decarboxylase